MITLFYLFNSFPEARGNGIALITALLVAGFGLYVVALVIRSSPRNALRCLLPPFSLCFLPRWFAYQIFDVLNCNDNWKH